MPPSASNFLRLCPAAFLCAALLCGCPTGPAIPPLDPAAQDDDDDSASLGDDDGAGDDDDSAEPPPQGIEISIPVSTPDAIGIRLEIEGTTVLNWTTVAPGESYVIEPLAIGWYDLRWEGAGVAGIAQVEVCEAEITGAEVPASPGAVFDCN